MYYVAIHRSKSVMTQEENNCVSETLDFANIASEKAKTSKTKEK